MREERLSFPLHTNMFRKTHDGADEPPRGFFAVFFLVHLFSLHVFYLYTFYLCFQRARIL